jgi:hypothetical protein
MGQQHSQFLMGWTPPRRHRSAIVETFDTT